MKLLDKLARFAGYQPIQAFAPAPFKGASLNRLNRDWPIQILSADQEVRVSLKYMRGRSRVLAHNNDYVLRFLNKAKENVIGANGITLQMAFDTAIPGADQLNRAVETAWQRFCENVSADGQLNFVDHCQLAISNVLQDGEVFQRKIDGYPFNKFRFALQFLDPDQVDEMWNRLRRPDDPTQPNEVRLGVEKDIWGRPVAYWTYYGHPSEVVGVVRLRVPAEEIAHAYVFKRVAQSRGVPWLHTAMTRLFMLGEYEEAELVAARLEACKMGYFVSQSGEEYTGGSGPKRKTNDDGSVRPLEMPVEPGLFEELPEGIKPMVVDWNHPNVAFSEFLRALLRGAAMGLNASYSTISGDLRDVNFSSLRQGVLDERDGWKVLQAFARDHIVKPAFAWWLPMAILSGQLQVPAGLALDDILEAANWTPRGWPWVDPLKDSQTAIIGIRSCTSTLLSECAGKGLDWRDVIDQRARENAYARLKGVSIDLTTSGAGGVEGEIGTEDPERGAVPGGEPGAPKDVPAAPPGAPPPNRAPKANGTGALHPVRLPI